MKTSFFQHTLHTTFSSFSWGEQYISLAAEKRKESFIRQCNFRREGNTHRERTEDLEKLSKKIERKSFLVYLVVLFSQRKSDQNFNVQFQLFPVFQEKLHWTFFNGLALKCQQLKSGQKLILDLILGTKKNCKNVLQIIRQMKGVLLSFKM